MLIVQYGYIFLVLIFLLLFSSPKGSENKETKISELGKYISYCTLSRAITITYHIVRVRTSMEKLFIQYQLARWIIQEDKLIIFHENSFSFNVFCVTNCFIKIFCCALLLFLDKK